MPLMLNSVQIAGNLTRDPEIRHVGDNMTVGGFGLAVNRKYKNKAGEMMEDTLFIDVDVWNRQAELCCQYLTKGRNVLVEGSLKLDQWQDKEGNKRNRIKLAAHRVHFIGGNDQNKVSQGNSDEQSSHVVLTAVPTAPPEPIDGEPPF